MGNGKLPTIQEDSLKGTKDKIQPELGEYGDLVIAYLEQLKVEYVFGIPGGAIEPLYNSLARSERRGSVKSIVARHETSCAFMADGYSRNSGKLGVCCATTGPGATNLITGVASAHENNVPMLVITAQTALSTFGKGAFQESSCTGINTVSLFENCTKYSSLVSHADQFESKLASAIIATFQDPMGPVHLSVPLDIMKTRCNLTAPSFDLPELLKKPSMLDEDSVDALYGELKHARKPVFLIGDGASEAVGSILTLAMKLKAQVLVTPHGKGLVSPYHPQFRGVVGFAGHDSANLVVDDDSVDLLIAVGSSLGEWETNGWDTQKLLTKRLVHVEETTSNLTRTPMARFHVRGRLLTIFEKIVSRFIRVGEPGKSSANLQLVSGAEKEKRHFTLIDEKAYLSDDKPIKPQRLMRELTNLFPPNTRFLADTGTSFAWATHYLHPYDRRLSGTRDARGGVFRAALKFASMGWAISAAIGTALSRQGEPVVCITGDGSLLMSGQELTVAVQHNLPIFFVVLNDSSLGMVKHGQQMTGAEQIGCELPFVDFAAVAKAMGAIGVVIESAQELLMINVDNLMLMKTPILLDVRIDVNEQPPIGMRTGSIKNV